MATDELDTTGHQSAVSTLGEIMRQMHDVNTHIATQMASLAGLVEKCAALSESVKVLVPQLQGMEERIRVSEREIVELQGDVRENRQEIDFLRSVPVLFTPKQLHDLYGVLDGREDQHHIWLQQRSNFVSYFLGALALIFALAGIIVNLVPKLPL